MSMICRLATKDDEASIKQIRLYAFENTKNQYRVPAPPEKDEMPCYPQTDYVTEVNGSITSTIGIIDFSQVPNGVGNADGEYGNNPQNA